jgi:hypothetical protein
MKLIQRLHSGPARAGAAVAIASLAALAAGCGSSTHDPSSTTSPQNIASTAFQYAVRNHGVNNFPDPKVSSSQPGQTAVAMVVPSTFAKSPQFKAAARACRGILPTPRNFGPNPAQEHAREEVLLAFARCLRSRGLTKFPDPTSQGQLTLEMIHAAGVDLHAPDVLPAARACIGVTHGLITPDDVARAINGQQ